MSESYDTFTITSSTLAPGTPVDITLSWALQGSFSSLTLPGTNWGTAQLGILFVWIAGGPGHSVPHGSLVTINGVYPQVTEGSSQVASPTVNDLTTVDLSSQVAPHLEVGDSFAIQLSLRAAAEAYYNNPATFTSDFQGSECLASNTAGTSLPSSCVPGLGDTSSCTTILKECTYKDVRYLCILGQPWTLISDCKVEETDYLDDPNGFGTDLTSFKGLTWPGPGELASVVSCAALGGMPPLSPGCNTIPPPLYGSAGCAIFTGPTVLAPGSPLSLYLIAIGANPAAATATLCAAGGVPIGALALSGAPDSGIMQTILGLPAITTAAPLIAQAAVLEYVACGNSAAFSCGGADIISTFMGRSSLQTQFVGNQLVGIGWSLPVCGGGINDPLITYPSAPDCLPQGSNLQEGSAGDDNANGAIKCAVGRIVDMGITWDGDTHTDLAPVNAPDTADAIKIDPSLGPLVNVNNLNGGGIAARGGVTTETKDIATASGFTFQNATTFKNGLAPSPGMYVEIPVADRSKFDLADVRGGQILQVCGHWVTDTNSDEAWNELHPVTSFTILGPTVTAQSATGAGPVTVSTNIGQFTSFAAVPQSTLSTPPPAGSYPFGFFNWTITGIPVGATATVTMVYPSDPGTVYEKLAAGSWFSIPVAETTNPDGSVTVTLSLTDGAPGQDADGAADGQITDPGGMAMPALAPTSTGVSCSPASVPVNAPASCTATVADTTSSPVSPSGTVTFSDSPTPSGVFTPSSSCTLSQGSSPPGTATCTASYTPAPGHEGMLAMGASYAGDPHHASSRALPAFSLAATKRASSTSVSCSPPSVPVNSAATCIATVTDEGGGAAITPTGTLTFSSDDAGAFSGASCALAAIATGAASCSVDYTPALGHEGSHDIGASYSGDTDHDGSSNSANPFTLAATTRSTLTSVSCTPNPLTLNGQAMCTVTVSDASPGSAATPMGAISLSASAGAFTPSTTCILSQGTNPVGIAACSFAYAGSSVGPQTITASYLGDRDHSPSSSSNYTLGVIYQFGGFLAPLASDGTYHLGRTIPVQFQLFDADHVPVSTAVGHIDVDGQPGASSGSANAGTLFGYDATAQTYIFNLSTKGLSPGRHTITVTLDDRTSDSVTVDLKAS